MAIGIHRQLVAVTQEVSCRSCFISVNPYRFTDVKNEFRLMVSMDIPICRRLRIRVIADRRVGPAGEVKNVAAGI